MSENNPFLALFNSSSAPPAQEEKLPENTESTGTAGALLSQAQQVDITGNQELNSFFEKAFRLTLRKNAPVGLVYLGELARALLPQDYLDVESLEQALFEYVLCGKCSSCVNYLFESYERTLQFVEKLKPKGLDLRLVHNLIHQNVAILLKERIIPEQDTSQDFITVLVENVGNPNLVLFLKSLTSFITSSDDYTVNKVFSPVLGKLHDRLNKQSLLVLNLSLLDAFESLASIPAIGKLILEKSTLPDVSLGRDSEATLLGTLFSYSCIPRSDFGPHDFFDKPSRTPLSVHSATEGTVWTSLGRLHEKLHKVIYGFLKLSEEARELVLIWIGKTLTLNSGRGQMWTQHSPNVIRTNFVSDGFMMNFTAVLLKLCEPFCGEGPKQSERLAKIDATYCATDFDPKRGVFLDGMSKETCLIPVQEETVQPSSMQTFTFLTQVFYLTNRAIDLGPKVCHERLVEISQTLNKMQRMFQDAQNQNSDVAEQIQTRMDAAMTLYLSYKAVLLVPEVSHLRMQFSASAARWLCATALGTSALKFPLAEAGNPVLATVPEFIVSNIADYLTFLRRFHPFTLEECGDTLGHFITLIIVFMGSPARMKNPHLRAALAGMLESLMPHDDQSSFSQSHLLSTANRIRVFQDHPHASEIVPTLLHVFVSIEMTGEGVAFQQKFNYRRPMYIVMKFLWTMDRHRNKFKQLAKEAEANMDAANAPLFLRFINLLINDANYLLDEALSYMAQIKEQQQQRNSGQWAELPADQRGQREATFQHMGMLAKFHNVMGLDTIHTLEMLTREIHSTFVHKTMVDRIAAMLNYFLLHLVGPKKRNFKVKDFQEFEFRPSEIVRAICEIYIHLYESDAFCLAVFQDSRSYSPQLFQQAEDVLVRISQGALIAELQQVAARVARLSSQQMADEELAAAAPEEFLDPIMSVVMTDPVRLPSSKVVVDRSTIARHLLSDQTDPFNRCPLTMEQVEPDDELRLRISQWLAEQRESKKETQ